MVSNYRYPITKSSNWIPVIGHARGEPITIEKFVIDTIFIVIVIVIVIVTVIVIVIVIVLVVVVVIVFIIILYSACFQTIQQRCTIS